MTQRVHVPSLIVPPADAPTADAPTADALYDVIARRRDVRTEFTGGPVDDAVLLRILDAAHRAPSVGMSQPWDFVLVTDRDVRGRFAEHVAEQRQRFAEELPPDRAETFAPITVDGVLASSLGIVVTSDPHRAGPHLLGAHSIPDTTLYSTCLAVQNLWLAATAEGLGVGWVSFYRERFLRDLLGIPEHVRPVAWLCVGPVTHLAGTPDLERHRWRYRRPLGDAIHHDRYDTARHSLG